MAANWFQNLLITNNELLDPVLFLRSVHVIFRNSRQITETFCLATREPQAKLTHTLILKMLVQYGCNDKLLKISKIT